jgi:GT2 family glycosyltransferase
MSVSALISAYYAEDFMAGRLQNLLDQDPVPDMVVVCKHDSVEEQIARDYGVEKIVTTSHIPTIGAAWNAAIEQASGDYCVIANTDDRFLPGGLKMLSDVLDNVPAAGYVFSDLFLVKYGITTPRPNHGRLDKPGLIPAAYAKLKQRYFCGPMPMWRRSLHNKYGYFYEHYIVASDYDWVLRLAKAGVGIYWLDRAVGVYEIRDNSLELRNAFVCKLESRQIRGASCE